MSKIVVYPHTLDSILPFIQPFNILLLIILLTRNSAEKLIKKAKLIIKSTTIGKFCLFDFEISHTLNIKYKCEKSNVFVQALSLLHFHNLPLLGDIHISRDILDPVEMNYKKALSCP